MVNWKVFFISYWPNGKISNVSHCKEGVLHGESISFDSIGKLIVISKYVFGYIDSTFKMNFHDSGTSPIPRKIINNIDKSLTDPVKFDTLVIKYNSKWNKKILIYRNDTLIVEQMYYKSKLNDESFYLKGRLSKRIFYEKNRYNRIKKIFYFNNKKLFKVEYYKKGKLHETLNNPKIPLKENFFQKFLNTLF
jgi:antitoxin component YwqK of YwqJK toxin-antitoxin module